MILKKLASIAAKGNQLMYKYEVKLRLIWLASILFTVSVENEFLRV